MFARLDCFEAVLYKQFPEEPRNKLAVLIRYWVNMLRSGQLITTDIVRDFQMKSAAIILNFACANVR
jgi:hypothetical protein